MSVLERIAEPVVGGELAGVVAVQATSDRAHVDVAGATSFGGGAMQPETVFRLASLTKPIAAVAALILVDEHVLNLDEPVDPWLPELADRRVLRTVGAALDDTYPAPRPITLRDLLTCRAGYGIVLPMGTRRPIERAMADAGIAPGPWQPEAPADDVMRRFGALPLAREPGEGWLYHSSFDILAVLIARAAARPFGRFLRERLFEPLGMRDTAFSIASSEVARLATLYAYERGEGRPVAVDDVARVTRPAAFESGATGLVGTAVDYLAFCRMLLDGGRAGGERIVSTASLTALATDQLTPGQRDEAQTFVGPDAGWGFGVAVVPQDPTVKTLPRGFGWAGGYGTMAWIDPSRDQIGLVFTQHTVETPAVGRTFARFWDAVYEVPAA